MPRHDLLAYVPCWSLADNLRYRVHVRRRAEGDVGFQRAVLTACKVDILYFLSAWAWVYEPRPKIVNGLQMPKTVPFLPWSHQAPIIRQLREHLGFRDIHVEKSRGEGMSWILIYLALHDWLFDDGAKVGLVSRTEKEADDPGDMDSLMAKADWAVERLPKWMAGTKKEDWERNLSAHSLVNYRNGAQLNADAATGDIFRGGRLKWAAMDEFAFFRKSEDTQALASSQGATNSRLFVSTVNGISNEFHRIAVEPSSNLVRIVMDWKDNPTKNRGLYRLEKDVPVAVDPGGNPLPENYSPLSPAVKDMLSSLRKKGFKIEGRLRSPWYDQECDRGGSRPDLIARELDRDYGGSMSRLFGHDFMGKAEAKVRRPLSRGNLIFHPETLEPTFDRSDDGKVLLWCPLNRDMQPPAKPYVVACDVATGMGGAYSSNSAIQVLDLATREQVLEFADNTIPPSRLADLSISICKWFFDAYLAWEINGPGAAFTLRVLQQKYGNVYRRKQNAYRGEPRTKMIGWNTNDDTKESMFEEIQRAVLSEELTLHSDALAKEFPQYVRIRGKIDHVLGASTEDDSARGKAHGDRVIALGVALMAARDRPLLSQAVEEYVGEPPPGSMAARKKEYDLAKASAGGEWDGRDNADLAAGGLRRDWLRKGVLELDLAGW